MVDMLITIHVGLAFVVYMFTIFAAFIAGIAIGKEMRQ